MRAEQDCTIVHLENSYASGQKKRPRGPRSAPTVEPTANLDAVERRPLVDLKTQAVGYYLHYHLQTLNDIPDASKGTSDDFLSIWPSKSDNLILDLAVSSIALAVFSSTQQHPIAATEASLTYHRLLQVVQVTISSLHGGSVDICLLAIFFMSRYEDAIHRHSHLNQKNAFLKRLKSFSHHDGALAVLKIWKDSSQPATDVIKHTRRGLIRSALMRNLAVPEWMLEGASFGEHGLGLNYDRIVVQIANVRQRLVMLLNKKTSTQRTSYELISAANQLNKEARDIDKALQDWTGHFPSAWGYQRHNLSKNSLWPMRGFYSPIVHSYISPAYAVVWNQYYATRMLINRTRLRVLEHSHPDSYDFACEQRLECLTHIKIMANDLASSLPFCLQRFKVADSPNLSSHPDLITLNKNEDIKPYVAGLTTWPLVMASSVEEVDANQRLWFRSELVQLGRVIGVGVLDCVENDQWLQL